MMSETQTTLRDEAEHLVNALEGTTDAYPPSIRLAYAALLKARKDGIEAAASIYLSHSYNDPKIIHEAILALKEQKQ